MNKQTSMLGAAAACCLAVLTACDSGGGSATSSGDGRTRLSVSNSYADMGSHVVHVNGFTTAALTPEIARTYDIVRSEDSGLVNLVVLRKADGAGTDTPVRAKVKLSAANLTGQVKNVEMREVQDNASVYYIGVVSVDDQETINFDFDIKPEDDDQTLRVRFSHTFQTR